MFRPEDYLPSDEIVPDVHCSWCNTDIKETKFCYVWTIKKFSCRKEETGEYIESSLFSSTDEDRNKWYLRLYPRGDAENKQSVSVNLYHPFGDSVVWAKFEISIINNKREKEKVSKTTERHKFIARKDHGWGFSRFIGRGYLLNEENNLLMNDELTIFCKVSALVSKNESLNLRSFQDSQKRVNEDLDQLLECGHFSDVILVSEDREIHAHKAILALRSPVFAAMFKNDMEEKQKNRVEITDIEYKVLEEMVRFLYTRRAPTMNDKMASQLLVAAEKYALEELKDICEQSLTLNLTTEKVMDLIHLSSMYNANRLKTSLIDFIRLHTADVVVNCMWDNLISCNPNRAVEIFSSNTAFKQEES